LWYSALFVVAGAGLLTVNYYLVRHRELSGATATRIVCQIKGGKDLPASPTAPAGNVFTVTGCPVGDVRGNVGGQMAGTVHFGSPPIPISSADAAKRLAGLKLLATRAQDHTLHTLQVESLVALGVMALASLGLGWLIAGRALRPVHRITNTARRLSEETLHERINLNGPHDEMKELADTFDAMLGRLDRAFSSQRRFVANASHELRTPLATDRVLIDEALANRGAGPVELRSILEDLRANNQQTERLIDALLVLARSERGMEHRVPVDLAEVAARVLERAGAEAVTVGVSVRRALAAAPATVDPALVDRLIGNLVENGIRHNLAIDGWVSVSTGTRDGGAWVQVVNSGQVMDPAHIPVLFEPFRRLTDRVSSDRGFGLGLSIVRSIADAHGAVLETAAPPEGGLSITVSLPAPRSSPAGLPPAESAVHPAAVS
jgi:signal transduction histidine kinase